MLLVGVSGKESPSKVVATETLSGVKLLPFPEESLPIAAAVAAELSAKFKK